MIWFEWTARRHTWITLFLVTVAVSLAYALTATPFDNMYGLADRNRDLNGVRVPFYSALHWNVLEFALMMFAAWFGATARENAAFLNLQPLSRVQIVGGRLLFGLQILAGLVLLSLLLQGLLMPLPATWMDRELLWSHLATDSLLIYLEAALVFGLATLLSAFVPVAVASLGALTPVLADVLLRSSSEGGGGLWTASSFYIYSASDLVAKGATPWPSFIQTVKPQQTSLTGETPFLVLMSAAAVGLVLMGALWAWKRRNAPGWTSQT
ncbi:hypothetical protein DEDE109153_10355 [Deinococcus deserti]|uniref:Uncharacterized protein n=1 Tax=Deinococcus deserti (strain DSM 17065 / CIP 109153 / LMG 22923 / VCD115) TaxID=546414 RepID=C1CZS8_DEIDV|nr:hypothetical protein [Deinococcus deserti]ACO45180.1 Hypothetical protein; putative membrane protein [Deinococcus deserti VCD115]